MTKININGVILAGGRSSRMKTDKGMISYHGKPQREYLFELLIPYCSRVFTSCKSSENIPERFNPLPDRYAMDTPLNGILSAFSFDSSSAWLSIPVDMPYVDRDCIRFLLDHRDMQKATTCFFDSTGKSIEPLLTIWEPAVSNRLFTYQKNGGESPREFLLNQEIHLLTVPHPKYLTNINSRSQFDELVKSYMEIS